MSNPPKSSPYSYFPLKTAAFCSSWESPGSPAGGSQPLSCTWEIFGTSEAGAECRGVPRCWQEGERPWAGEKHGVNGIWAKSRQAAPGCCSALMPEQPGTAGERKSQPAPALNPVFLVEWLEMPSSWGLWGTGSHQRPRCFWEATKPGWELQGQQEGNHFRGCVCAPDPSYRSQQCWKRCVHAPSLVVGQLGWGKMPACLGNTSRREKRRE